MENALVARIVGSNLRGDRQPHDFYATPRKTVEALLDVEKFDGDIWEPCCGQGHISEVLIENNYEVESTDLIERGYGTSDVDFLSETEVRENIVTNPPYKDVEVFVRKALDLSEKKVALLLRLNFLEGVKRRELFQVHPPTRIYVFSARQALMKNGNGYQGRGGMMALAWFVWDKNLAKANPVIDWI